MSTTHYFRFQVEPGDEDDSGDKRDDPLAQQFSALLAPIYQEFHGLYLVGKLRTRVEVMLGISELKLEVYPKTEQGRKFWTRQKSFSNERP